MQSIAVFVYSLEDAQGIADKEAFHVKWDMVTIRIRIIMHPSFNPHVKVLNSFKKGMQ